jgi:hypothetical protein
MIIGYSLLFGLSEKAARMDLFTFKVINTALQFRREEQLDGI